jgi:hypothetical protein
MVTRGRGRCHAHGAPRFPREGLQSHSMLSAPHFLGLGLATRAGPSARTRMRRPGPSPTGHAMWTGPMPSDDPNGVTRRVKGCADGQLTMGVCRQ